MTVHTTIDSPLGPLLLVGEERPDASGGTALAAVSFADGPEPTAPPAGSREAPAPFRTAAEQLHAYFAGGRTAFDLEFTASGTEFRQRVWAALEQIPYGATVSYGRLAQDAGARPGAVRAVAAAIGANPLLVVRPCHRVIGADGSLTGYAAGLERKRWLLELERAAAPLPA